MPFDLAAPLVTLEDVIRLRDERDRIGHELLRLKRAYELADSKLTGIAPWLPEHVRGQILKPAALNDVSGEPAPQRAEQEAAPQNAPPETLADRWARVVIPLLEQKGHSLTTGMIRQEIEGQPIEAEVGFQGRNLLRALKRLTEVGVLVRDGEFYGLPGQKMPEGGMATGSLSEQMREAIIAVLQQSDTPLVPSAIRSGFQDSNLRSLANVKSNTFYNSISKLLADGRIQKIGDAYKASSKKNEPSSGRTLEGSDAASVSD